MVDKVHCDEWNVQGILPLDIIVKIEVDTVFPEAFWKRIYLQFNLLLSSATVLQICNEQLFSENLINNSSWKTWHWEIRLFLNGFTRLHWESSSQTLPILQTELRVRFPWGLSSNRKMKLSRNTNAPTAPEREKSQTTNSLSINAERINKKTKTILSCF